MARFDKLAERQILKASAEGKLSGLEGEGKPLPDRSGEAHLSPGEAMGFRIMAEAGALPEEIVLQKRIDAARAELAALPPGDETARKKAQARLSELMMRHAIAREARQRFLRD